MRRGVDVPAAVRMSAVVVMIMTAGEKRGTREKTKKAERWSDGVME